MQFRAYLHGTAVCHWQRLTKCREYMVAWASKGVKPLVEGLDPPSQSPLSTPGLLRYGPRYV